MREIGNHYSEAPVINYYRQEPLMNSKVLVQNYDKKQDICSLKIFLHTKLDTQYNCAFFRERRGVISWNTGESERQEREYRLHCRSVRHLGERPTPSVSIPSALLRSRAPWWASTKESE